MLLGGGQVAEVAVIGSSVAVPVAAISIFVPILWSITKWANGEAVHVSRPKWWLLYWFSLVFLCTAVMVAVLALGFYLDLAAEEAPLVGSICKVLSRDVDLRTAKLCSSPSQLAAGGGSDLRCYFDYYWASVFEVEFWPHSSRLPLHAAAETPHQLLPATCRPGFKSAWRIKESFQVNASYPCHYHPSNLKKVKMATEGAPSCAVPKASGESLRDQFWHLLTVSDEAPFSPSTQNGRLYFGIVTGISQGVLFSVVSHMGCRMSYKMRIRKGHVASPSDRAWIAYQASTEGVVFLLWTALTLGSVVVQLGAVDVGRVKKWVHHAVEVLCTTVECGSLGSLGSDNAIE